MVEAHGAAVVKSLFITDLVSSNISMDYGLVVRGF
jgi:hypothetical protein